MKPQNLTPSTADVTTTNPPILKPTSVPKVTPRCCATLRARLVAATRRGCVTRMLRSSFSSRSICGIPGNFWKGSKDEVATVLGAKSWNINPSVSRPFIKRKLEELDENHVKKSQWCVNHGKKTVDRHIQCCANLPRLAQALRPYSHGSSRFTTACGCHDDGDTIGGNGLQDLLGVAPQRRICISWCPFNGSWDLDEF